jgi:hypothetical protein
MSEVLNEVIAANHSSHPLRDAVLYESGDSRAARKQPRNCAHPNRATSTGSHLINLL